MFRAIGQFFAMIYSFAAAGEVLGKATEDVAAVAKTHTQSWRDQAEIEAEERVKRLRADIKAAA